MKLPPSGGLRNEKAIPGPTPEIKTTAQDRCNGDYRRLLIESLLLRNQEPIDAY
jgi:hypothetical protein